MDQEQNDGIENDFNEEVIKDLKPKKEKDFISQFGFWSSFFIGLLLFFLNGFFGAGLIVYLVILFLMLRSQNKTGAKGLSLGFFLVIMILLLACGTCFLGGNFF